MKINFRTEILPEKAPFKINLGDKLITLGSCFSNNLGDLLVIDKFDCHINRPGTLYHPQSINSLIEMAIDREPIDNNLIVEREGVYYHHLFHSSQRSTNKADLIKELECLLKELRQRIVSADVIFLTWGTSWVYQHIEKECAVANCHKVPSSKFTKELSEVEAVVDSCTSAFRKILSLNPDVRIVLTVSPVRHLRDGLRENNVSKAVLLQSAYKLEKTFSEVSYYPAYELVMDDLRDYRYFERDLIHPNALAVDYIYEHFKNSYFSSGTLEVLAKWKKVRDMMGHKVFNPGTESHIRLLNRILSELKVLGEHIPVEEETEEILSRIRELEN